MSSGLLKIEKPYIEWGAERAMLIAKIDDRGVKKELTYTVDKRYGKYLTQERSDAFIISLLYYAMFSDYDIEWETPCSEQLIYQLETFYIPVCAAELPFMNKILLKGPLTTDKLLCAGGAGTGFSAGVDSLYTIHKYMNINYKENRLTHLIFTDCFTSDYSEEHRRDFLENYLTKLPSIAAELGLEFIFVGFNIDTLFSVGRHYEPRFGEIVDAGFHSLKYCSLAMALQKLFNIYYFSAGFNPSDFTFITSDSAYYDIFTLPLITTGDLKFYSSGMEAARIEKVESIADWEFAKKHLQVCEWDIGCNCGRCGKCIRTMSELYALGKLEAFQGRFPVEDYKRHLGKKFAYVQLQAYKKHIFERNILTKMRENGIHIPVTSYALLPLYIVGEWFRLRMRRVKWARRIYRKLCLDRLLYGRSTEKYAQSIDKER